MKLLYIFPHPDDESFGPAAGISYQLRQGHEVYLLTLTKGGATKERFRLGLSVEEMGEVRHREMLDMAKVLGLTELTVLDLPDSGLKEMDPREIERIIAVQIERVRPDIIITYPVHGISGFEDHLVCHAVVKRVYLELREQADLQLRRLAFFTQSAENPKLSKSIHNLKGSKTQDIDCAVQVAPNDVRAMADALACYKTYQETVAQGHVMEITGDIQYYEFYQESHKPPIGNLCSFE